MRWSNPLATAALLLAIAPAGAAAQANSAAADTREVLAYRLTMPKLRQLNQLYADLQKQREADPAYQGLAKKQKELAALQEKEEPTQAEMDRMDRLAGEIEAADRDDEGSEESAKSLTDIAQQMAADPRMAAALKRAGLAPREAATMLLAMFQAGFAASMLESGTIEDLPKDVSAENVKFWQTHKAEISALTALSNKEKAD